MKSHTWSATTQVTWRCDVCHASVFSFETPKRDDRGNVLVLGASNVWFGHMVRSDCDEELCEYLLNK